MMRDIKLALLLLSCIFSQAAVGTNDGLESRYQRDVQRQLQSGWATVNPRSVFEHVLLPDGLSLRLCIASREMAIDNYLNEAFISSRSPRPETIYPGLHAFDNSYTELTCDWHKIKFRVESAQQAGDLYLLVTPLNAPVVIPEAVLEVGMLWNRHGNVSLGETMMRAALSDKTVYVRSTSELSMEHISTTSKYISAALDRQVAFYTGTEKTLDEIKTIISEKRDHLVQTGMKYGRLSKTFQAIQGVLAWNTIYDASHNRIITPVSRLWNFNFGGQYVLFDWDTYFAAYMSSLGSKALAYANAVEVTKGMTPDGFVPNFSASYSMASFDRSQPPVGSLVFKELYRKYREKWILEYVFDDLMRWNRWWIKNRVQDGLLCWGSNKVNVPSATDRSINEWQGAAYESGLDNSPMFDGVPFSKEKSILELGDAGLMGLYVMDCDALAEIAVVLGKRAECKELRASASYFRKKISLLWDKTDGIYKNKRTDINEFSNRISPTNFYPLLARAANRQQAESMVNGHLLNPKEFNGKWMLPSISMNDKAFANQEYWRGRIWGPLNFLVYLGLLNYDVPEAKRILAEKSLSLMMENVDKNGWIYENYNALTGNVGDVDEGRRQGDNYYHWGALLGFMSFLEDGFVANPMKPLLDK